MREYFTRFFNWCNEKNTEITWFLIGVTLMAFIDSLAQRNYGTAVWNFFVLVLLYFTRKLKV
jgi:hypothetical protein